MRRLVVIGAGGHGRSVAEAAMLGGAYFEIIFLDDAVAVGQEISGVVVCGSASDFGKFSRRSDAFVVALGSNERRQFFHDSLISAGMILDTVIHPGALISPTAVVGRGSTLLAGAIVGSRAHLGEGVIVNCGAVIDHDCHVGAFAHLGINAGMSGGSVLGTGGWLHAGSTLGSGAEVLPHQVLRLGEALGA